MFRLETFFFIYIMNVSVNCFNKFCNLKLITQTMRHVFLLTSVASHTLSMLGHGYNCALLILELILCF